MPPKFERLDIEGLILITPQVFPDERGFFLERFRQCWFDNEGIDVKFVQDSHSHSQKGVVRGLHYSLPPMAQAKLVWVTRGEVFDVAVDLRKDSPTFGKWKGTLLSEDNKQLFFLPVGFAHGLMVLSDEADVQYKLSAYYSKDYDCGVRWNDPDIGVAWPLPNPIVSERDQNNPFFKDLKSPF